VQLAEDQLAALRAGPRPYEIQQVQSTIAGAQAALSQAQSSSAQAQAAVAQAQAARDLVALQIQEATIRAPFAGIVSQRQASEGSLAGPSTPIVTLLSSQIDAVVNVDESMLGQLHEGQRATFSVLALAGTEIEATVVSINPVVDPQSRSIAVYLTPSDGSTGLRPGSFVQARIQP
jgi:RND family efflux transporter MFP subunit